MLPTTAEPSCALKDGCTPVFSENLLKHFIRCGGTLAAAATQFPNCLPCFRIWRMARVRALRFEYEPPISHELPHHGVHDGRERNAEFFGGLLGVVAKLLRGLDGQCRIHTTILLLVRLSVKRYRSPFIASVYCSVFRIPKCTPTVSNLGIWSFAQGFCVRTVLEIFAATHFPLYFPSSKSFIPWYSNWIVSLTHLLFRNIPAYRSFAKVSCSSVSSTITGSTRIFESEK